MTSYSFCVPGTVISGSGCVQKIGSLLQQENAARVLLISDRGLERSGLVARVKAEIENAGLHCDTFLDVEPNPSVETVEAAVSAYRAAQAEAVVAVGGGSPMDVSKAVSIIARYGGDVHDYEGADKVPGPTIPLFAIPTTAGTGSEVTASAVITDRKTNYKFSILSRRIVPHYALLDAELIRSLPMHIAASTGVDALVHATESYISRVQSPFADAMAEKALQLLGRSIRRFVANREDLEAAQDMLNGSMFAGIAFAWARLGNVHAMSHPVSGHFNVPHGVANAILFPYILDYNALADEGRYRTVYDCISRVPSDGSFRPEMLGEAVRQLNAELGLPAHLSDVGVTGDAIAALAADAMKSGNVMTNPRMSRLADIEALYQKAL